MGFYALYTVFLYIFIYSGRYITIYIYKSTCMDRYKYKFVVQEETFLELPSLRL